MDMLEKVQLHVGAAVAGSKRPAPDPPASTRADPFKIPYREFCTLADLSPQPCTLAASDLPNAASSDTLSAPVAETSGPPLREYQPTGQGTPPRGNESLQELFETRVMSNYTPRDPKLLPLSAWVSIERLMSELRQHAPAEVDKLGLKGVKQMITESQMDHPAAFAGLPFSAWCKKLKDHRPQAHYRAQVMKFPFAHTPQMY